MSDIALEESYELMTAERDALRKENSELQAKIDYVRADRNLWRSRAEHGWMST